MDFHIAWFIHECCVSDWSECFFLLLFLLLGEFHSNLKLQLEIMVCLTRCMLGNLYALCRLYFCC